MVSSFENNCFELPFATRAKRFFRLFGYSFVIGFLGASAYTVAYCVYFHGPENFAWGIAQAIYPESEVKERLVKAERSLSVKSKQLAKITDSITAARKLGPQLSRFMLRRPKTMGTALASGQARSLGGGRNFGSTAIDSFVFRLKSIGVNSKGPDEDPLFLFHNTPMGAPVSGEITSMYGRRNSPFTGFLQTHRGIDISSSVGAQLFATADGIVESAGWNGSYGNCVLINHGVGADGTCFETVYAHLSNVSVKPGVKITRGQKIGFVGSTGNSTGPHVHYEVRKNGVAINPTSFINLAKMLD